jgi:hypothetical protein
LKLEAQGQEIRDLKARWEEREAAAKRKRALFSYLGLLALVFGGAVASAWWCPGFLPKLVSLLGIIETRCLCAIFSFVLLHLLLEWAVGRKDLMKELWPFQQVSRLRRWLWTLGILGFGLGIVGNLVANRVQQRLDEGKVPPPNPGAAAPARQP